VSGEAAAMVVRAVQQYIRYMQQLGVEGLPLQVSMDAAAWSSRFQVALRQLEDSVRDCTRCALHRSRTQVVFGTGDPSADLVFVGEAPGEAEDHQGEPFVGPSGHLLTRIIEAMGLRREQVYILNIVKCRPPKNRDPYPDELAACRPILQTQLDCLQPRVICTLGKFASQALLQTDEAISRLRGRFHTLGEIPVMPTYHPAYLLRNPHEKRVVWQDIQAIQKVLNRR
jgi:uracil-DNA glycosylase family 4